jgi:hypothetical protein
VHKNLCATFCGKPVETVESVENANKGRPASETGKSRHALRTAHRAYRMTCNKKFQKTLDKSTIIWYNADSKGGIEMKTINHLSIKAMMELEEVGSYDTKKYRYIINQGNGNCYRIDKELLGKTEALDPENWVEQ